MIEMNVAIICACLPMCRLPLAYLFPATLGTAGKSTSDASEQSGAALSGCKSRDGPRADEEKGARAPAVCVRAASEEIMLRPMSRRAPEEDAPAGERCRDSGIRKTTWFEVRCEEEGMPGRAL